MDLQYVVVFVVTATIFFGLFNCQAADMSGVLRPNSTKFYCGTQLSQTLSAICKGIYNTLNRKSDIYKKDQGNLNYPFRNKASARTMTNYRRKKRGVFNECCQKPCSYEELATYCG